MNHPLIVTLLLASLVIPFRPREERVVIPSPDKKLSAYLIYFGDPAASSTESKIEIRSKHRRPLCMVRFRSKNHRHGMRILGGSWTPDGSFFVFNGVSTDGSEPGHYPAYFYARRDNKIRRLDPYTGSWIAGGTLRVSAPDSVSVVIGDPSPDGSSGTTVWAADLKRLLKMSAGR